MYCIYTVYTVCAVLLLCLVIMDGVFCVLPLLGPSPVAVSRPQPQNDSGRLKEDETSAAVHAERRRRSSCRRRLKNSAGFNLDALGAAPLKRTATITTLSLSIWTLRSLPLSLSLHRLIAEIAVDSHSNGSVREFGGGEGLGVRGGWGAP